MCNYTCFYSYHLSNCMISLFSSKNQNLLDIWEIYPSSIYFLASTHQWYNDEHMRGLTCYHGTTSMVQISFTCRFTLNFYIYLSFFSWIACMKLKVLYYTFFSEFLTMFGLGILLIFLFFILMLMQCIHDALKVLSQYEF